MNDEVKLLYETLKDVANALDYCGDSYERSVTRDSRDKAADIIEQIEKKYEIGKHSKENKKAALYNKYYRCPWCDKEHLKNNNWISIVQVGRGGRPGKHYYELGGLIDHAKMRHEIKQKDTPKEFEGSREDWFISILSKKQEELEHERENFVDED